MNLDFWKKISFKMKKFILVSCKDNIIENNDVYTLVHLFNGKIYVEIQMKSIRIFFV